MTPAAQQALLDRVNALPGPPPCVCTATAPGVVYVAVRTVAHGSCVIAIDAREWDAVRCMQLLGAPVPPALAQMIREVKAGAWSRQAQEDRARAAAKAREREEADAAAARTAARAAAKGRP